MTDETAALRPVMAKLATETGNLGREIVDVAGDAEQVAAGARPDLDSSRTKVDAALGDIRALVEGVTAIDRNRRMFNDRVGLASGRNTKPTLLQTYRRDMGGGTFALMKDASAPIVVRGRRWGGFRMGYKA
jgi:hypothetical protein